eukprot:1781418-Prymnesium_polylepis.1
MSTGNMYVDSSDLELMHDAWLDPAWALATQIVGITFPNVQLPWYANVTSAKVLFTVDEVRERTTTAYAIPIHGEASANAAAPSGVDFDL